MLLPPSEGKADDADRTDLGDPWDPDHGPFGRLGDARQQVAAALADVAGGDRKLLGVGGDHLERARRANTGLLSAPTLPAWKRYTGVVWDHLDPASLSAAERRRIVVVSGMAGLARGDEPLPDYRLKMGANLAPLGKLSTWWRPLVTDELHRLAGGRTARRPRTLVDLLPKEHRAAWAPDGARPWMHVEFVDPSGAPGGHFAKAAKGELARALLLEGWDALTTWSSDRFELRVTVHPDHG
ncbi:MAG: peroxide stress protein YaaA [Actinomycetota bacterium]